MVYSAEILTEYKRVLSYEKLNIAVDTQESIYNAIEEAGIYIKPVVSTIQILHEDDRIFYDIAKTSGATLITGNIKHYPDDPDILTPTQFLELVYKKQGET